MGLTMGSITYLQERPTLTNSVKSTRGRAIGKFIIDTSSLRKYSSKKLTENSLYAYNTLSLPIDVAWHLTH